MKEIKIPCLTIPWLLKPSAQLGICVSSGGQPTWKSHPHQIATASTQRKLLCKLAYVTI